MEVFENEFGPVKYLEIEVQGSGKSWNLPGIQLKQHSFYV